MMFLEQSKQFFPWEMFEREPFRHMKETIYHKFKKSPVHLEVLNPNLKFLWIAGKTGILNVPYFGQ